ncbi:hypothetical protein [Thermasporomyces composti]|jgi:hypothetical protein|uniref:Lipoprotein LpqN n=1 Tax=Thermasporomyces composti TaxID=696763 RepID=A0A3D9V8X6_THECX|nr:hypothetical protein [Thermasporomyces composti]REF36620.1 hypothetical protein DFJ64_2033 [Thermasporomyces composti]
MSSSTRRIGRGPLTRVLAVGVLLLLASGCGNQQIHPTSLKKLPPTDPPPRTAQATEPSEASSDSDTTTGGLQVTCAVVQLGLPTSWQATRSRDGWAVTLPETTGGGGLRVTGTYLTGEEAPASESELRTLVQGDEGDDVSVDATRTGLVVGRLAVRRGTEWRLATMFEEGTQLVTLTYSPAGSAQDRDIDATTDLLDEIIRQSQITDPGSCE